MCDQEDSDISHRCWMHEEESDERSHQRSSWAWREREGIVEGMRLRGEPERFPSELLLYRGIRKTSARPMLIICAVLLLLANSASALHFAQPALRVPSAPGMMARCSFAGAVEHGGDALELPADLRFLDGGFFVAAHSPHPTRVYEASGSTPPCREQGRMGAASQDESVVATSFDSDPRLPLAADALPAFHTSLAPEAGSFAAPHAPRSEGEWRANHGDEPPCAGFARGVVVVGEQGTSWSVEGGGEGGGEAEAFAQQAVRYSASLSSAQAHSSDSSGAEARSGLGVRQLVETRRASGKEAWETAGGDRMCGVCGVMQVAFGIPIVSGGSVMDVGGGKPHTLNTKP